MKYSDIIVQPLRNDRYKVVYAIRYKDIIVPAGYRTNGADIPRALWSYIPPNWSDALPAVIVHDYMCDVANSKEDYERADSYFMEILEVLRVKENKAKAMGKAVTLYTNHFRKYT